MSITASAPGKILLLGGYSVLERPNAAYVLAVDAYVHAKVDLLKTDEIIIKVPQFKTEIKSNSLKIFDEKNEPAKFVLSAITATLNYFKSKGISYSGFILSTKSDREFSVNKGKSGLGSSAAVTVATIAALFESFGLNVDKNRHEFYQLAQFAHAKAQDKIGSGFDIASACYGSIKYIRFSPQLFVFDNPALLNFDRLDSEVKQISFPSNLKLVFASFPDQSMSTTGAVGKIMEFKKNNPNEYEKFMQEINTGNKLAIEALEKGDMENFKIFFEKARVLTKNLGKKVDVNIESDEMTELIEETKQNGAFVAKLPGAGGGDAIVAICSKDKDAKLVKKFWKKRRLNIFNLNVNNEGVKVQ